MKTINNRKSIRKYSHREVSEELLNRLLSEAERTPTMGNLQLYSVIVTRSKAIKRHWPQPISTSRWLSELPSC